MQLSTDDYTVIRNWIYRNARPLDLARWQYHFENGEVSVVLEALAAYQNSDGGFGHALEADSWNPHSTPIQTASAAEKLAEIDCDDSTYPVVQGILRYLASGADVAEGRWRNTVPSNNDYPHAPWWHTDSASTSHSEYNPTAILAGFILRFADRDSKLYAQGLERAGQLAGLFLQNPQLEMHPLKCLVAMLNDIEAADVQAKFAFTELKEAVSRQIKQLIERDVQEWDGYSCRPSVFIKSPESPFYASNQAALNLELDYLLETRNEAGVWDLTWKWASYEQEFAVSENWWKADIVIARMRLLRAFQRVGGS